MCFGSPEFQLAILATIDAYVPGAPELSAGGEKNILLPVVNLSLSL
jgi:hypothetical protein